MSIKETELYVACGVVGLINTAIFCSSSLALLKVLRAAALDAYSSPRRRLLALDDGSESVDSRSLKMVFFWGACVPWTTQKALLAMVSLTAALRVAWAFVASQAWDAMSGVLSHSAGMTLRSVFYGLNFFQAAAAFTLYTIVARFWAELAYAARQGTVATRPIGGGDEYRPRDTSPLIWKAIRIAQRGSSIASFVAAAVATVLQATIWEYRPSYLGVWTGYTEAMVYFIVAIVVVTAAYHAVVEVRLVPIELPTRRRRVFRIVTVTGSIAACLIVRSMILFFSASGITSFKNEWSVVGILSYMGLLDAVPLAIVVAYNRTVPLSSSPSGGVRRRVGSRRGQHAPEEEPLIGGTRNISRHDDDIPFTDVRPEVYP